MTLLKYHFKAKVPLLCGLLLGIVSLQILMLLGLRIWKVPFASMQVSWNLFFALVLWVVAMCILFIVSYKLYRENITNYYKCLLPVKDTSFILAPLLFWFICSSVTATYFIGSIYVYSLFYNFDDLNGMEKGIIESMMLDNYFAVMVSHVEALVVSCAYLLLLFFAYTAIKLVIKGKKFRACMMAIIFIVFVALDFFVANWVLNICPAIMLEEKTVVYEVSQEKIVETVSYGFNFAHFFIVINLCIVLIYSTAYLLKVRKDI